MDQEPGEITPKSNFSQEKRDALIKQFKDPDVIKINGETVKVVDILPANQKTKVPVVIAPGWISSPEVFEENILSSAELGRRTISIKSYHGIETSSEENFPDAELRKMAALIKVLDQKGIDKVDAIGHSEAGPYLTIAATLFPDKFRNIILVNPVGMIGKDNIASLSIRFSSNIINEIANGFKNKHQIKPMLKSFSEAGKSVVSGPLQTLKQSIAISGTQIQHQLKELKEKGIGISIIQAVGDRVYPMDKVQKIAKKDQFHGFYSVEGTHNTIYLEARKYSSAADAALTALESKERQVPTS